MTYSPAGVEIVVPGGGVAVIEEQLHELHGAAFRARLKKPMPFNKYAENINSSDERISLEKFEARFGFDPEKLFPGEIPQIIRERGLSARDLLYDDMLRTNCLGMPEEVVLCVIVPWRYAHINLKGAPRGTMVEYTENLPGPSWDTGAVRVFAGRIWGKSGSTVFVEFLDPLPFARGPELMVDEEIKPAFGTDIVWTIGRGLHETMKRLNVLPAGEWVDEQQWEYRLLEPVAFSEIEKICKKANIRTPACWLQGLTLYLFPIEEQGSTTRRYQGQQQHIQNHFHPMRNETAGYYGTEVEVQLTE